MLESARKEASDRGQGVALQVAQWMSAVLCNASGRYAEAVAAARDAVTDRPQELFATPVWTSVELLEASTRSDNPDVARIALERIVAATTFAVTDSALGILARSRALASDGETAERLYQEAIERLGRTRLRPELARAHLLYGEWLRREGRRVDARAELHLAHGQLATIGMEAFAERAPAVSWRLRARTSANAPSRPVKTSPHRRRRSHGSPATASRTRDRRAAVHQPAHGRLPPAQDLHQAGDHLTQRAFACTGTRRCARLVASRMTARASRPLAPSRSCADGGGPRAPAGGCVPPRHQGTHRSAGGSGAPGGPIHSGEPRHPGAAVVRA